MSEHVEIGGGLKKHVPDHRDYSHHKTFGVPALSDLPDAYTLLTEVLNQGITPKCTDFASESIEEAKYDVKFDLDKFWEAEGIENGGVTSDGYDLRTTMSAGKHQGFVRLDGRGVVKEDDYFSVEGPYDLFDSIRAAMWLAKDEKRCVMIGTMWYSGWTYAHLGIITTVRSSANALHAIKCAGWKTIDGVPYLVMQNSYGQSYGDRGLFYFPREVVNREFVEGHYMWRSKVDPTQKVLTIGLVSAMLAKISIIIKAIKLALNA